MVRANAQIWNSRVEYMENLNNVLKAMVKVEEI